MRDVSPEALWARWRERTERFLEDEGFSSFVFYLKARPLAGLSVLAEELEVAPVHVEKLIYEAFCMEESPPRAAREALYRSLLDLEEGWPSGHFSRITAVSLWISGAKSCGLDRHAKELDGVADALMRSEIEAGWVPGSVDDPVLLQIFESWQEKCN